MSEPSNAFADLFKPLHSKEKRAPTHYLGSAFGGKAYRLSGLLPLFVWMVVMHTSQAECQMCGITSLTNSRVLIYPPIARAAHVEGIVVTIVSFDHDGKPLDAHVVTGPQMLHGASLDYVKGLQANAQDGSRACPMVEEFRLEGQHIECGTGPNADFTTAYFPRLRHPDPQHVKIIVKLGCITVSRDPAAR